MLCSVALALPAAAQDFELAWHTVDGGGATYSSGGDFELSGTIAQSDVGSLTGDAFTLEGGFWAGVRPVCAHYADVNADGKRDGRDIQAFIGCLISEDPDCTCADLDASRSLDAADVELFVAALLANGSSE
jgi:hypothetical protein